MNEEALKLAYQTAQKQGYKKSIGEFQQLLQSNEEALQLAYKDATNNGYNRDINAFSELLGVSKKKEQPVQKQQPQQKPKPQEQYLSPLEKRTMEGRQKVGSPEPYQPLQTVSIDTVYEQLEKTAKDIGNKYSLYYNSEKDIYEFPTQEWVDRFKSDVEELKRVQNIFDEKSSQRPKQGQPDLGVYPTVFSEVNERVKRSEKEYGLQDKEIDEGSYANNILEKLATIGNKVEKYKAIDNRNPEWGPVTFESEVVKGDEDVYEIAEFTNSQEKPSPENFANHLMSKDADDINLFYKELTGNPEAEMVKRKEDGTYEVDETAFANVQFASSEFEKAFNEEVEQNRKIQEEAGRLGRAASMLGSGAENLAYSLQGWFSDKEAKRNIIRESANSKARKLAMGLDEKQIEDGVIQNVANGNYGAATLNLYSGVVENMPQIAVAATAAYFGMPNVGLGVLAASAGGASMADMAYNPDVPLATKYFIAAEKASTEFVLEKVGMSDVRLGAQALRNLTSAQRRQISMDTARRFTKETGIAGKAFREEFIEEGLASFNEQLMDNIFFGTPINYYEIADAATIGGFSGGTTAVGSMLTKLSSYRGSYKTAKLRAQIFNEIEKLAEAKRNPDNTPQDIADLEDAIKGLQTKLAKISASDQKLYDRMDDNDIQEIVKINRRVALNIDRIDTAELEGKTEVAEAIRQRVKQDLNAKAVIEKKYEQQEQQQKQQEQLTEEDLSFFEDLVEGGASEAARVLSEEESRINSKADSEVQSIMDEAAKADEKAKKEAERKKAISEAVVSGETMAVERESAKPSKRDGDKAAPKDLTKTEGEQDFTEAERPTVVTSLPEARTPEQEKVQGMVAKAREALAKKRKQQASKDRVEGAVITPPTVEVSEELGPDVEYVTDDELAEAMVEGSETPSVNDKILNILDKAIDATSGKGRAFDATLGLPLFAVNSALKIARAVYVSGKSLSQAIARANNFLKENGYSVDYDELDKFVTDILTNNAIQEQTAGEVPVQPKAEDSKKVEGGKPKSRPEKATEESKEEQEVEDIAEKTGITPKNFRDLYNINRELFGLDKVKAFASAIAMDRMVGAMAKRARVSKKEMYGKLEFRKATDKDLPQGVKMQVDAWHGSPYQFDKFTTQAIGTGEGAQAFGWGLYFTDLEGIAKAYADKLTEGEYYYNGEKITDKEILFYIKSASRLDGTPFLDKKTLGQALLDIKQDAKIESISSDVIQKIQDMYNGEYDLEFKKPRKLYKVSLHKGKTPDQYTWLEWDKQISEKNANLILSQLEKERKLDAFDASNLITKRARASNKSMNHARLYVLYKGDASSRYELLSKVFGSPKEASLFLLRAGIDGIKYPAESVFRGATSDTARGFNYVIFDENAVSIEEVIKFQKDANKARGAMMMTMDGKAIIYALTDPNVSTPLHEMAHVFEHYLTEAERNTVLNWAKSKEWTTEVSEKFARGFEKFLAEGKAPTTGLEKVFQKFKEWLNSIYNGIVNSEIDIELNKPMRDLYASMFDTPSLATKLKEGADSAIAWLDNLESQLDEFSKGNLGMNIPVPILKAAIQAAKLAVQAGAKTAEIVAAAVKAMEKYDGGKWYKKLRQSEQNEAKAEIKSLIENGKTESQQYTETIVNASDEVKQRLPFVFEVKGWEGYSSKQLKDIADVVENAKNPENGVVRGEDAARAIIEGVENAKAHKKEGIKAPYFIGLAYKKLGIGMDSAVRRLFGNRPIFAKVSSGMGVTRLNAMSAKAGKFFNNWNDKVNNALQNIKPSDKDTLAQYKITIAGYIEQNVLKVRANKIDITEQQVVSNVLESFKISIATMLSKKKKLGDKASVLTEALKSFDGVTTIDEAMAVLTEGQRKFLEVVIEANRIGLKEKILQSIKDGKDTEFILGGNENDPLEERIAKSRYLHLDIRSESLPTNTVSLEDMEKDKSQMNPVNLFDKNRDYGLENRTASAEMDRTEGSYIIKKNQYYNPEFITSQRSSFNNMNMAIFTYAPVVQINTYMNTANGAEVLGGNDNMDELKEVLTNSYNSERYSAQTNAKINETNTGKIVSAALNVIKANAIANLMFSWVQSIKQSTIIASTYANVLSEGGFGTTARSPMIVGIWSGGLYNERGRYFNNLKSYLPKYRNLRKGGNLQTKMPWYKLIENAPVNIRNVVQHLDALPSDVFLPVITQKHQEAIRKIKDYLFEHGGMNVSKTSKALTEAAANAYIVISDRTAATISWLMYYDLRMTQLGKGPTSSDLAGYAQWWEENGKNPNEEAIAYANALVADYQNISSPQERSRYQTSKGVIEKGVKDLFFPLTNFLSTLSNSLFTEYGILRRGLGVTRGSELTKEDAFKASIRLAGMLTAAAAFSAVSLIPRYEDDEDDADDIMFDKDKLSKRNRKIKNAYTRVAVDMFPLLNISEPGKAMLQDIINYGTYEVRSNLANGQEFLKKYPTYEVYLRSNAQPLATPFRGEEGFNALGYAGINAQIYADMIEVRKAINNGYIEKDDGQKIFLTEEQVDDLSFVMNQAVAGMVSKIAPADLISKMRNELSEASRYGYRDLMERDVMELYTKDGELKVDERKIQEYRKHYQKEFEKTTTDTDAEIKSLEAINGSKIYSRRKEALDIFKANGYDKIDEFLFNTLREGNSRVIQNKVVDRYRQLEKQGKGQEFLNMFSKVAATPSMGLSSVEFKDIAEALVKEREKLQGNKTQKDER